MHEQLSPQTQAKIAKQIINDQETRELFATGEYGKYKDDQAAINFICAVLALQFPEEVDETELVFFY